MPDLIHISASFLLVTFNLNGRNGFLGNYEYLTILLISHPNSSKLPHVLPCLRENEQNLARTRLVRVFITQCGTDLPQVDYENAKANDPHDDETEGRTPFRHTANLIDEYGLKFCSSVPIYWNDDCQIDCLAIYFIIIIYINFDCLAIYDERKGGEDHRKKYKFQCTVAEGEAGLVKLRERIW